MNDRQDAESLPQALPCSLGEEADFPWPIA